MSAFRIALHAVVAYVFLLALIRVSGKRVISQATGLEFVLAIIIGDLVDDAIFATTPMAQLIVAAGTLALVHVVIGIAAMHSLSIWRVVEGESPVVVQNGIPQRRGMRHERLNRKDIASLLRLAGISAAQWAEIKRARIEEEGRLAVVFHDWAKRAQRRDAEWVRARLRERRP